MTRLKNRHGVFKRQTAFTLIEVLVALTIVGVALGASLRAVASMTNNSEALRHKLYASWSAENRLNELRLIGVAPASGSREFGCPQGRLALLCVEDSRPTANVYMQRVELKVFNNASREKLLLTMSAVMMK